SHPQKQKSRPAAALVVITPRHRDGWEVYLSKTRSDLVWPNDLNWLHQFESLIWASANPSLGNGACTRWGLSASCRHALNTCWVRRRCVSNGWLVANFRLYVPRRRQARLRLMPA